MAQNSISEEEVRRVAGLARLSPSDDDVARLRTDMATMLEYVGLLDELDTEGIEATTHPVSPSSPLRPDVVTPGCDPEEALAQAPASRDGGFAVPKVLEVEG